MSPSESCCGSSLAGSGLAAKPSTLPHLPQHGAAGEAVRVRQRLQKFEMIVGLTDDQLRRLAGRLHGGKEFARLALELRRLLRAVGEDQRRVQAVEMALGAELLHHC